MRHPVHASLAALGFLAIAFSQPCECRAQVSGNIAYGQGGGKARAEAQEQARRVISRDEMPPDDRSMFIEASVLMNVKPDEYVAVFGVAVEAETVPLCQMKMGETLAAFGKSLVAIGIKPEDRFVDFVAQEKVYKFEIEGDVAREQLAGFELKKNVLIHYQDRDMLDRIVAAAAEAGIFDLIKVDCHVRDLEAVRDRLMIEATGIAKRKAVKAGELLGINLAPSGQVYAARPGVHYPTDMYDMYVAQESESISGDSYRQRYTVQSARKGRTFFYNGLDGDGFDRVINPIILEPAVQFTLDLKIRYRIVDPPND